MIAKTPDKSALHLIMKPQASVKLLNLLQKSFYRLSIRQKIFCGYGLAGGITVLGTILGVVIGEHHFQPARQKAIAANQEGYLLTNLQGALLEIEVHEKEFIPILVQQQGLQQEIFELTERMQAAKTLSSQLAEFSQASSQKDLQDFVHRYDDQLGNYLDKLNSLNQAIIQLNTHPGEIAQAQELIWSFSQSQTAYNYHKYTQDLSELARTVIQREQAADFAYDQAVTLQVEIMLISRLLSVAMATIMVLYTSKLIAQPINAVTDLAQKVTQENNFDLQVPVITQDEIGSLANSLNQLIQQVKHLLEAQAAETQTKLIQSEKMSSLGRMLAGIAHEINNPVNFISGNLVHAQNYFADLLTLIHTYKEQIPDPPTQILELEEQMDLAFLEVDLPKLFNSIMIGVDRTKEIVRGLKDFSRVDEGLPQTVDIHNCLDSTLLILNNRLKKGISVVRSYGEIPVISGYPGLLYQVFMNLLSNASDALDEKLSDYPDFSPEIKIVTEREGSDWIVVRITDNGPGIAPENLHKIFEMFFTTKARGIGTGLGLAISYQIIVEKHQGKINCYSELNQGTEFAIALPIHRV